MNITRLRLENFKRHRELDIELAPGLNIVRGANEAGKTTVQRALEMALFRRPTSTSQDVEEARSWHEPGSDPIVELDFVDDEARGSLRKTFAGQRGTVELRVNTETFVDPAAVEAQVARLTGLPSEKFFRATASVHQQELGGLTQDENTLRDRLQQSMSGADRGTYAARRKLEEAIRRYKTEGAKNPGYLKVLRSEVDRLREEVRRGEAALLQLGRDRQALADARATRAELDRKLAEQRDGVARAERAATLTNKGVEATRRYTLYKRAAELREEIANLEASHPSPVALPTLRAAVEHLRSLEFDLSEMRAELATEPDLSGYDVAIPTPRWRPWAIGAVALLVGAFVIAGAAAALGVLVVGVAIGGVLVVLAAACGWMTVQMRRHVSDIRLQNELRESEIARRLAGRTDLSERVRQSEQERAEALASLNLPDLPTADRLLAAATDHIAQIGARKAEYRGLLGDAPADEDVGLLRDRAAAEADECRHALAGMGELGRDPERHLSTYRLAVQRSTTERETAVHAEAQANARVTANEVDAEKVAADAEALETAEEALAATERRLRIYEDVLATLNGAERATMKKAARFLEQQMARDIERITEGRYRRLRVDEATLTFSVFSPETNDWLDVRQLSQGTLDQLYLCARLGIVRQVTQPASPPLIFDDPFITFDDERAANAVALLKEIAREHQVIYLTTSDRYDAHADRVVVLAAPTERDEPEPVAAPTGPPETLSVWSTATFPAAAAVPHVPLIPPVPAVPVAAGGNGSGHGDGNGSGVLNPVPRRTSPRSRTPSAPVEPVELRPLWPVEDRWPVEER